MVIASYFQQRSTAAKFEPLKAPMFDPWERLGYGSATNI